MNIAYPTINKLTINKINMENKIDIFDEVELLGEGASPDKPIKEDMVPSRDEHSSRNNKISFIVTLVAIVFILILSFIIYGTTRK